MLKLMKYEFRKQAFSKLIILIIAALGEVMFFTGFFLDKNKTMGLALGLLTMFTMGALFFIAFESIITYYNDLKQKQSYMLFLTPHTPYTIVGAKVISAALQVILSGFAFALLFAIDGAVLLAKYSSIKELKSFIEQFIQVQFNIDVNGGLMLLVILAMLTAWISIITLSYLSITLSTTFLAEKRGKAFISFVIFVALNFFINKLLNLLGHWSIIDEDINYALAAGIIVYAVITTITFLVTSWMLDKKVSV